MEIEASAETFTSVPRRPEDERKEIKRRDMQLKRKEDASVEVTSGISTTRYHRCHRAQIKWTEEMKQQEILNPPPHQIRTKPWQHMNQEYTLLYRSRLPQQPHRGQSRPLRPNKPGCRLKSYQKQTAGGQRQGGRVKLHAD